jgi:cytochrome c oxidase assembly factor CtaG
VKRASAPSIGMTTPRSRVAKLASSIQIRHGLLAAGAALAYFALGLPLIALPLGPRAAHMPSHILLMNALAPVLASAIISRFGDCAPASARVLIAATAIAVIGIPLWSGH